MTTATMTYHGTLVQTSCWCSIALAIPADLYNAAQVAKTDIWCPLGHKFIYTGTENERLQNELRYAKDRAASYRAAADQAEASLRATKGHVTRLRKEVLAGKCPFCGQHLRDLERHITRQHATEPVEQP